MTENIQGKNRPPNSHATEPTCDQTCSGAQNGRPRWELMLVPRLPMGIRRLFRVGFTKETQQSDSGDLGRLSINRPAEPRGRGAGK